MMPPFNFNILESRGDLAISNAWIGIPATEKLGISWCPLPHHIWKWPFDSRIRINKILWTVEYL